MANRSASTSSSRQSSKSTPPGGRARKSQPRPAERDEHYDLVSVLYHALQGAETSLQYVTDAREAGDQELVTFLEQTQEQYEQLATRAKQLLATRLDEFAGVEDDAEESDEEEEEED